MSIIKKYPCSVSMTPSFWDNEQIFLRTQLKCLSEQTVKDFDVWLIDPHYNKRKDIIPELANRFKLDIKHIPYSPNTHIAKNVDCSIFNAGYCYSESPINIRYSCYRFVRNNFIESVLNSPKDVNIDFHMLCVGPCIYEYSNNLPYEKHKTVWNFDSEDVNWENIPTESGYDELNFPRKDNLNSLGNWHRMSDVNTDIITVPMNLYGNIAWYRNQWLELNGTNEVITNFSHWEDLDFDCRAGNANQKVIRKTGLLYRLWHQYGKFSQRSNIEVDVPYVSPCNKCKDLSLGFSDEEYGKRLGIRITNNELEIFGDSLSWVCKDCKLSGPIYGSLGLGTYFDTLSKNKNIKAPVIKKYMIGRNLTILSEKMDREMTLSGKVDIFNSSWTDLKFYEN
jgi:hypothetical protein